MNQERTNYLLTCLIEEAAEIIKEATKAQRFGLHDNYLPLTPEQRLKQEVNDLLAVREMLLDEGLDIRKDRELLEAKKRKVERTISYRNEQEVRNGHL